MCCWSKLIDFWFLGSIFKIIGDCYLIDCFGISYTPSHQNKKSFIFPRVLNFLFFEGVSLLFPFLKVRFLKEYMAFPGSRFLNHVFLILVGGGVVSRFPLRLTGRSRTFGTFVLEISSVFLYSPGPGGAGP